MHPFKTFVVCVEAVIVVGVSSFFIIEGFEGNAALTVILLALGISSLVMLVGFFIESRKHS